MKKILIISSVIIILIALSLEIKGILSDRSLKSFDYVLDENNFAEILKTVHDNIDKNIGKTIKLSGFVFKLPDFKQSYFVCGRDMLLNNESKVVGFLCESNESTNFIDSQWVEITGEFIKGYYVSDMPVIKVKSITKITAPSNTYVKTPNSL